MLGNCLEILTIGLPFCAFKIITGLYFGQYWLVVLGLVDLIFNVINLFSLLLMGKRIVAVCFLSFLINIIKKPNAEIKSKWQDLGSAIDVLISFSLVAYVVGGNFIKFFPAVHVILWNVSVVLNVLGAGYGRLVGSIKNLKQV